MTASNIAVCFVPSLFHLSPTRSSSSSPRKIEKERRKTVGVTLPESRQLNETRFAYECLACMVSNFQTLFTVSLFYIIEFLENT